MKRTSDGIEVISNMYKFGISSIESWINDGRKSKWQISFGQIDGKNHIIKYVCARDPNVMRAFVWICIRVR